MQILLVFICLTVAAVWHAPGLAEATMTSWHHRGAQVKMFTDGSRHQFYYEKPTAEQLQSGIRPGVLLFDGRREGDRIVGSAYVYPRNAYPNNCSGLQYAVAGSVSPDQRTITIRGRVPVVAPDCRVVGFQDDVLRFDYAAWPSPGTIEVPDIAGTSQDGEYKQYERDKQSCFDQKLDIYDAIRACGSALLSSLLKQDDRIKLDERRAALTRKLEKKPEPPIDVFSQATTMVGQFAYSMPGRILSLLALGAISWWSIPWIEQWVEQWVRSLIPLLVRGQSTSVSIITRPPSEAMSIKLKRSQRISLFGRAIFMLDARIDVNAEESSLIAKYRLGTLVVYDSKSRKRRVEATRAHLEMSTERASFFADAKTQFLSAGKAVYRLGRASVSAAMASLSLRITVNSLIRGVHIECKSLDELIAAESVILESGRSLKGYLETAATFDGREEVIGL